RQLFDTHRFEEIGDYLAAEAKKLRGTVQADTERRQALRANILETVQALSPSTEAADPKVTDLDTLDDGELVAHVEGLMTQSEADALRRVEQAQHTLNTTRDEFNRLQQQEEQ